MKNKGGFSNSIERSLEGRSTPKPEDTEKTEPIVNQDTAKDDNDSKDIKPSDDEEQDISEQNPSIIDRKGRGDKGLGLNKDGSFRQSNAGRKTVKKTRPQITLTLAPETVEKLAKVDEKGYRKLMNRYIDKNIDHIVEELAKL